MGADNTINSVANTANSFMSGFDNFVTVAKATGRHFVSLDYSHETYSDKPNEQLKAREKGIVGAIVGVAICAIVGMVGLVSGHAGYFLMGLGGVGAVGSLKEIVLQDMAREKEKEKLGIEDSPENTYDMLDYTLDHGAKMSNVYERLLTDEEPKEASTDLAKRLKSKLTPEEAQTLKTAVTTAVAVGIIGLIALTIVTHGAALPVLVAAVVGFNLMVALVMAYLNKHQHKDREALEKDRELELKPETQKQTYTAYTESGGHHSQHHTPQPIGLKLEVENDNALRKSDEVD